MTREAYLEYCRSLSGTAVDQPFRREKSELIATTHVARHADTKKWYAAVMVREGKVFVNLKCDPEESDFLRRIYRGITPGYHMNKQHWNSVYLDSDVPEDVIKDLTAESFRLTGKKERGGRKENRAD